MCCLTLSNIDLPVAKDLVMIIGTIGALVIGFLGLRTWRRQLRGTSEYEVAKKALLLTYQVRDAMQGVRAPMLYLRKEEVEAGRSLEEEQRIYDQRMQRLQERWAELRTLALEARVIWGEDAEAQFSDMKDLIRILSGGIWLHFWLKGTYAPPGVLVDNRPERVKGNDAIVYCTSEEDEFSLRIDGAVGQLETFFQKHIRA